MAGSSYDSITHAVAANTDFWVAVTSDGSSVKFIVDGSLVDTGTISMRLFRGVSVTDLFTLASDYPIGGRPADGTSFGSNVDVRRERAWGRVLTLAEVTAEAASATPIITAGILSNVGLTSTSDLSDTVAGRNFSTVNPNYTSTPSSSGDGYVRFSDWTDGVRRTATFLDMSGPFTLLWHGRTSVLGPADMRLLGNGSAFDAPYLWVGISTGGTELQLQIYTSAVNQIPINTTTPCCGSGGSGTSATGPILPAVSTDWTPRCTGGGTVPTASDLTTSEDWSA